jgi:hypothetical protein
MKKKSDNNSLLDLLIEIIKLDDLIENQLEAKRQKMINQMYRLAKKLDSSRNKKT